MARQSREIPGMWAEGPDGVRRRIFGQTSKWRDREIRRMRRYDAYVRSTYIELPMRAAQ